MGAQHVLRQLIQLDRARGHPEHRECRAIRKSQTERRQSQTEGNVGKPAIERDSTFEVATNDVVPLAQTQKDASQLSPDFAKHTESYIMDRPLAVTGSRPISVPYS